MSKNTSELDDFRQWWCWAGNECVMGLSGGRGVGKLGFGSLWTARQREEQLQRPRVGMHLSMGKSRKLARLAEGQGEESGGRCCRGGRAPFAVGLCYFSSFPGFPLLCPVTVTYSNPANKPVTSHETIFPLYVRCRHDGDSWLEKVVLKKCTNGDESTAL